MGISLRVKAWEASRESEGVVVLEVRDSKTLASPETEQGKGPCLNRACVQEVSARECL